MVYEIGDIVGWHVDVLNRDAPTEMQGLVVAIDGNWLCIRASHIKASIQDPFIGRQSHCVHLVKKAA